MRAGPFGGGKISSFQRRQSAERRCGSPRAQGVALRPFRRLAVGSKSWEEFARPDAPNLDFVFTVCDNAAEEVCPIWPGQPMTAHWGLPDPVKALGGEAERHLAFSDTLRMLNNRIGIFVSLPLEKLSKLSLQKQLDAIGQTEAVASQQPA
jgi:arsenate reductase (thioredoxin)